MGASAVAEGLRPVQETDEWVAGMVAIARQQATETVVLDVGVHEGCGGTLEYTSRFAPVSGTDSSVPQEEMHCVCLTCGKKDWNVMWSKLRDPVLAYRQRNLP